MIFKRAFSEARIEVASPASPLRAPRPPPTSSVGPVSAASVAGGRGCFSRSGNSSRACGRVENRARFAPRASWGRGSPSRCGRRTLPSTAAARPQASPVATCRSSSSSPPRRRARHDTNNVGGPLRMARTAPLSLDVRTRI